MALIQASLLKFVIISALIVVARAQFRMIAFAVLGLAGLWMVQNIARSSAGAPLGGGDERSQLFPNFSVANLANRFLTKRSSDGGREHPFPYQYEQPPLPIDWEVVLNNDHSTCARSYLCQVASAPTRELTNEEAHLLRMIKRSTRSTASNWASKQLAIAVRAGQKWRSRASCMKLYRKCPYTSAAMRMLLSTFASSQPETITNLG